MYLTITSTSQLESLMANAGRDYYSIDGYEYILDNADNIGVEEFDAVIINSIFTEYDSAYDLFLDEYANNYDLADEIRENITEYVDEDYIRNWISEIIEGNTINREDYDNYDIEYDESMVVEDDNTKLYIANLNIYDLFNFVIGEYDVEVLNFVKQAVEDDTIDNSFFSEFFVDFVIDYGSHIDVIKLNNGHILCID